MPECIDYELKLKNRAHIILIQKEMTNFGGSVSSNVSLVHGSLLKEETNSSVPDNMEIRNFDFPNVKEEFPRVSCENIDVSTVIVKEEMLLEGSSEPYDRNANTKEIDPGIGREDGEEGLNDCVSPFCFVGIKMEKPDNYEGELSCSETKHFSSEYAGNCERECLLGVEGLEENLHFKLSNPCCIDIKMEKSEDIDNCESDFHTNNGTPVTKDENSELDSCSTVHRCDQGHASNELIRGIECQKFPILCIDPKDKVVEQFATERNNPGSTNACRGRRGTTEDATEQSKQGAAPFSCETCGKGFRRRGTRDAHALLHSRAKPFACDECGRAFANRSNLRSHSRVHSGCKPHSCEQCGKRFAEQNNLLRHGRVHSGDKPYSCSECGKRFSESSNLQAHSRIHSGVKPFSCDQCDKSFSQRCTLQAHRRIHTKEKPFVCNVCGTNFTMRGNLHTHMKIHSDDKPFSCEECGKSFNLRGNLQTHKKIHSDDKRFSCEECGKSFSLRGNLRAHTRTHSGYKPFTCEACGKSFSQRCNLQAHARTHSGDRPFVCTICGKSFSQGGNLRAHMRIHSGNTPFSCTTCGKSFAQRVSLVAHERTHPGDEPASG